MWLGFSTRCRPTESGGRKCISWISSFLISRSNRQKNVTNLRPHKVNLLFLVCVQVNFCGLCNQMYSACNYDLDSVAHLPGFSILAVLDTQVLAFCSLVPRCPDLTLCDAFAVRPIFLATLVSNKTIKTRSLVAWSFVETRNNFVRPS